MATTMATDRLDRTFAALADPTRRAILTRLTEGQATVTELATGAPVNGRVELGGPEALGIDAWARRLFAATGDERTVVSDPHARYYGTELKAGELTPGDGARIGATDFDTWFAKAELGPRG